MSDTSKAEGDLTFGMGPGTMKVGIDGENVVILLPEDEGKKVMAFKLTVDQAKFFANAILRKAADLEQMRRPV